MARRLKVWCSAANSHDCNVTPFWGSPPVDYTPLLSLPLAKAGTRHLLFLWRGWGGGGGGVGWGNRSISDTHRKIKDTLLIQELQHALERFSIDCRKTKTKVITTANQNKGKCSKEPIKTQSKYK